MTGFVIIAALLTAAALLFVLPPLLSRVWPPANVDRTSANVQVYREQLAEIDTALATGQIGAQDARAARAEIEHRLLDEEATSTESGHPAPRRNWRIALLIAALLPSLAASLYVMRGRPAALLEAERLASPAKHLLGREQIQALVQQLRQRLVSAPADAEGWRMLARSQLALGEYTQAAHAYARASALIPTDAQLLADYADVLAMAQGKRLSGAPAAIIEQALAIDPQHPKALALAGTAAFERQDYVRAIDYWDRVQRAAPPQSPLAQAMSSSIVSARQRLAQPNDAKTMLGARLTATVGIAPELRARQPVGATLFVFARAEDGSPAPIAIVRRPLDDLPLQVVLDDTTAMNPARRLSDLERVIVVARISVSGQAQPQPGDLEGASGPVAASGVVNVQINRIVR